MFSNQTSQPSDGWEKAKNQDNEDGNNTGEKEVNETFLKKVRKLTKQQIKQNKLKLNVCYELFGPKSIRPFKTNRNH